MSTSGIYSGPAACLAALAGQRDPVAWGDLLADLGACIQRCCTRNAGASLAEDAVQETLLHLRDDAARFKVPPGCDPDTAARAWVLAVATNSAHQVLRRERRIQQREVRFAAAARGDDDSDPAVGLLIAERAAAVRQALASLPPAMRNAVALRHIEGLGSAEIAVTLGCPEGTAKALVHRGLERLRRKLGAPGAALDRSRVSSMLAALPFVPDGGSSSLAAGPALLTATCRPTTAGLSNRSLVPKLLPRHALFMSLLAAALVFWLWPRHLSEESVAAMSHVLPQAQSSATPLVVATNADLVKFATESIFMPLLPDAASATANGSSSTTRVSSSWGLADEQGRWITYQLEARDVGPWLEARREGALLWSGPVGTAAERARVPEELVLGISGLGLDFDVHHNDRPGARLLNVHSGGQNAMPSAPQ